MNKFLVDRIHRLLRNGNYAEREGSGVPLYLSAVIIYSAAKELELAGNALRNKNKTGIILRHLKLAKSNKEKLNKILSGVTIAQSGVLPKI